MNSIRKIKRKDLDVVRYEKSLKEALNYRIYAESWYLDVLTNEKWECWVYGDYEVIMPVPLQYKFGIKFVLQPIYCQQLGVFYTEEISDELFKEFERKIHSYRVRAYHFNEENTERYHPKGELKVNQILDLTLSYVQLRKKFNRNRRRKLVELPDGYTLELSEDIDNFMELYKVEYPEIAKNEWVLKLSKIMKCSFDKNIGYQCRIMDQNGLNSSLFYIVTHKRIFQLGATRHKNNTDAGFFTLIINHVINNFSEKEDYYFDFEGSMIPGVTLFNESFGAIKKYYTSYKNISIK